MKVMINGRELTERVQHLEQQERNFMDLIGTAAVFCAGALLALCLPGIFDAITDLFTSVGPHILDAYHSIR
jgi:hypothetical protein